MADLETTIHDAVKQPRKASGDSGSVEMHSLKEQIEADRYLKAIAETTNPARGLRFTKMVPPGTT